MRSAPRQSEAAISGDSKRPYRGQARELHSGHLDLLVLAPRQWTGYMRENNSILLDAEEQLVFGTLLGDMREAETIEGRRFRDACCLNCWTPRSRARKRRSGQMSARGALKVSTPFSLTCEVEERSGKPCEWVVLASRPTFRQPQFTSRRPAAPRRRFCCRDRNPYKACVRDVNPEH